MPISRDPQKIRMKKENAAPRFAFIGDSGGTANIAFVIVVFLPSCLLCCHHSMGLISVQCFSMPASSYLSEYWAYANVPVDTMNFETSVDTYFTYYT
ncbi:hypothetical protein BU16DRAFT_228538 [Lophium mytilinum]|uniref:Uncharacterized protein n=1 Tax=Lophium mytilinum TaxID=390894 RepID=A0A6A6Q924_9PEZI|nr:hypothetical protein BU16DRAFT_228538 [Lophium mytilinum]